MEINKSKESNDKTIDINKLKAINMLRDKFDQIQAIPKKEDFESNDMCFIKQKLGPWPRALEAAGLKEVKKNSAKEKNLEKRKRMKEKRKQIRKEKD